MVCPRLLDPLLVLFHLPFLVSSCDRCVPSPPVSPFVRPCCPVGQLDGDRPSQRRVHVGGSRVHSERRHAVAPLLFCQFPLLLPAAGTNKGDSLFISLISAFLTLHSHPILSLIKQLFPTISFPVAELQLLGGKYMGNLAGIPSSSQWRRQ